MAANGIDLGLTHTCEPGERSLSPARALPVGPCTEPLPTDELVLVVLVVLVTAPGHALTGGSTRLPLTELAAEPLIR